MGDSHLFLPTLLHDLTFSRAAEHPTDDGRLRADRRYSAIVALAVLLYASLSRVVVTRRIMQWAFCRRRGRLISYNRVDSLGRSENMIPTNRSSMLETTAPRR